MPTATEALAGVRKREFTVPQMPPPGRRRSRPIENIMRLAAPWIAIVHTKTEARITSRYSSPNVMPAKSSCGKAPVMMVAIGKPPLSPSSIVSGTLGMARITARMNTTPTAPDRAPTRGHRAVPGGWRRRSPRRTSRRYRSRT